MAALPLTAARLPDSKLAQALVAWAAEAQVARAVQAEQARVAQAQVLAQAQAVQGAAPVLQLEAAARTRAKAAAPDSRRTTTKTIIQGRTQARVA